MFSDSAVRLCTTRILGQISKFSFAYPQPSCSCPVTRCSPHATALLKRHSLLFIHIILRPFTNLFTFVKCVFLYNSSPVLRVRETKYNLSLNECLCCLSLNRSCLAAMNLHLFSSGSPTTVSQWKQPSSWQGIQSQWVFTSCILQQHMGNKDFDEYWKLKVNT